MRFLKYATLFLVWVSAYSEIKLQFTGEQLLLEQIEIPDSVFEGIHYTSAKLLEKVFKSEGVFDPLTEKFAVKAPNGKIWTMIPGGTFLLIGDEVVHLPYPVFRSPSDVYLPSGEMLNLLRSYFYARLKYTESTGTITYDIGTGNILNIFHRVKDNGSLVEIRQTSNLPFETLWVYPHFIINIEGGKLGSELLTPQEFNEGLVRKISTIQDTSVAQITLYIPGAIDTVTTMVNKSINTLSVIVRSPDLKKVAAQKVEAANKPAPTRKTIIIDAGHGGKDPGAIFKEVNEKSVTLAVAKKLETELIQRGFNVKLTRRVDEYLTLKERPEFATRNAGDMFISLHCNSIGGTPTKQKSVSGYVAYILRAGQSQEDNALARRENEAIKESTKKNNKTEISTVEWILLEHELNLYSHQSEEFAEKIVKAFEGAAISKHRTGAHQAGFFVLVGTFMPAVLFEMGFLTNAHDRTYMSSAKGQQEIAHRLSEAVDMYFSGKP